MKSLFFGPSPGLQQGLAKLMGLGAVLLLSSSLGVLGSASRTVAAEKLVLTYGPIGDSVEVAELKNFVETGEIPRTLRPYLQLTNTDPEAVRAILSKKARVGLRLVDRVLRSLPGEYGLFQLGQVIHTPRRVANVQALRAAMVLSLADDSQISLLEFLEKYPTQAVVIDGVVLARVARTVGRVAEDVKDKVAEIERRLDAWLAVAQDLLENLVCDCEPTSTPTGAKALPSPTAAPEN